MSGRRLVNVIWKVEVSEKRENKKKGRNSRELNNLLLYVIW